MLARLLLVAAVSGTSQDQVFDFVPSAKLFGICYQTVHTVIAEQVSAGEVAASVEPVCYKFIASYARQYNVKTLEVMDHCSELGGRVAEAEAGGYLEDGSKVCGSIVEEDAEASSAPLDAYLPVESAPAEEREAFCKAFAGRVDACGASDSTAAPTAAPLPFVEPPPRSDWEGINEFGKGEAAVPPPPENGTMAATEAAPPAASSNATGFWQRRIVQRMRSSGGLALLEMPNLR